MLAFARTIGVFALYILVVGLGVWKHRYLDASVLVALFVAFSIFLTLKLRG